MEEEGGLKGLLTDASSEFWLRMGCVEICRKKWDKLMVEIFRKIHQVAPGK